MTQQKKETLQEINFTDKPEISELICWCRQKNNPKGNLLAQDCPLITFSINPVSCHL